jgi:hypothetical protein
VRALVQPEAQAESIFVQVELATLVGLSQGVAELIDQLAAPG